MNTKKVSVAEGKRSFTQLLKQIEKEQTAVLIFRRERFVGAILSSDEYDRLEKLSAYFEALHLSKQFEHLQVNAAELVRKSRQEMEERS